MNTGLPGYCNKGTPYPGYCATVLQQSQKFRVRVDLQELTEVVLYVPYRTQPWIIQHLTYFPFLPTRTLTIISPCCNLPVFCSWDMMTFHKKLCKIHYVWPQFWSTKWSGGRKSASAKYQTGTIEKRRSAPQSPRNSACPFSSFVHYTPVAEEKVSVPPYGCTVLLLKYCPVLL